MAEKKGFGKSSLLSWVASESKKGDAKLENHSFKKNIMVKKEKKSKKDKDDVTEKED